MDGLSGEAGRDELRLAGTNVELGTGTLLYCLLFAVDCLLLAACCLLLARAICCF